MGGSGCDEVLRLGGKQRTDTSLHSEFRSAGRRHDGNVAGPARRDRQKLAGHAGLRFGVWSASLSHWPVSGSGDFHLVSE